MAINLKGNLKNFLRWMQKYTKTDMFYIAKGTFWWLAGRGGLSFVSFAMMVAFARWLPKEEYGTYQFVLAGLGLLGIFILPGIDTALIKSIAQKKEGTLKLAVKEKIKWGSIGSFLCLGVAGWYFLQKNNLLAVAFLLGAFFLPFKTTFHIFSSFWNGRKRFDLRAKYDVLSAVLGALFLIPAVYLTNNVPIILLVFLGSHTFFDFLLYKNAEKQTINDEEDPTAISFGRNLTLINGLQTAAAYLDKIIIWNFLGPIPVAVYTFAKQPIQRIKAFFPITFLALPKLGEKNIDNKRKKGIISKFLRMFVITIPVSLVLVFLAPFLYCLVFPKYMESVAYFQAFCVLVALLPFLLLSAALTAEMKKKSLYITNTVAPLLNIILLFLLIPNFGIWGVVVSVLAAELLKEILTLYFFLKI